MKPGPVCRRRRRILLSLHISYSYTGQAITNSLTMICFVFFFFRRPGVSNTPGGKPAGFTFSLFGSASKTKINIQSWKKWRVRASLNPSRHDLAIFNLYLTQSDFLVVFRQFRSSSWRLTWLCFSRNSRGKFYEVLPSYRGFTWSIWIFFTIYFIFWWNILFSLVSEKIADADGFE